MIFKRCNEYCNIIAVIPCYRKMKCVCGGGGGGGVRACMHACMCVCMYMCVVVLCCNITKLFSLWDVRYLR